MPKNEQIIKKVSVNHLTNTMCLGACSTSYGDYVCRGCGRSDTDREICNDGSIDEREELVSRLSNFAYSTRPDGLKIGDEAGLIAFLNSAGQGGFVRFSIWFALLRWFAQERRNDRQIDCPATIEVINATAFALQCENWLTSFHRLATTKYHQELARQFPPAA